MYIAFCEHVLVLYTICDILFIVFYVIDIFYVNN